MPRRGKTKRIRARDVLGQGCIKLWIGPRTVPVRSGHEGKKAPEGPTPKPIPTRCEPGRFAVRNIEHRTSNIQHPISKGGAKPPKATPKPYSRHILGIDSGVQSHPKATSKPTDSQPIGTPKPHQCDLKATPKPPQSYQGVSVPLGASVARAKPMLDARESHGRLAGHTRALRLCHWPWHAIPLESRPGWRC